MTTQLLRPDWSLAPADAPDEVRPFELPDVSAPLAAPRPVRDTAWTAGYQDGHAEGLRDGLADGRRQGLEQLRADQVDRLSALEGEVVDLALDIADMVLGHHVAASGDPGAEALKRALGSVRPTGPIVARLHPEDLAILGGPPPGPRVQLVEDESVGRGGCVLDTGSSTVDATLDGALERVRAVLSPRSAEEPA